jgi:hypothetical protein
MAFAEARRAMTATGGKATGSAKHGWRTNVYGIKPF